MSYKMEQRVKVAVTYNLGDQLVEILEENQYKNPMIVVDHFMLNSSIIKETFEKLEANGISYYVYDQIVPDPPINLINQGAEFFSENSCDSLLAIGGGSVIDAARGINIVRSYGGSIQEYVFDKTVAEFCPGLISVPTTSGTGSELSNALVITDPKTKEKLAVLSNNAVSEYAVLCPELVKTLPKQMTIMTGLDVFSHAAEAYTSTLSSPVIDAICEKIMFLVVRYLPKAVRNPEDLEARERMMVAASLGGWVLNNGGTHLGHSVAHVVGAKMHLPHGMACAYSLPATLLYTSRVKAKKVREIGGILDAHFPMDATDMEIGEMTVKAYKNFRDDILGLPLFAEQGISREDLMSLTNDVVNERFARNSPFEVTPEIATSALNLFG